MTTKAPKDHCRVGSSERLSPGSDPGATWGQHTLLQP